MKRITNLQKAGIRYLYPHFSVNDIAGMFNFSSRVIYKIIADTNENENVQIDVNKNSSTSLPDSQNILQTNKSSNLSNNKITKTLNIDNNIILNNILKTISIGEK